MRDLDHSYESLTSTIFLVSRCCLPQGDDVRVNITLYPLMDETLLVVSFFRVPHLPPKTDA
jgi:hypothetical protein